MSGICPTVPSRERITFDDTPPDRGAFRLESIPNVLYNTCGGANNQDITQPPIEGGEVVIVNTQCCPAPGPVGPTGATGPQGDPGFGYLWQGQWASGNSYIIADVSFPQTDVVFNNGSAYVCIADHTADVTNEPGSGASWTTYWELFTSGGGTGTVVWRGYWQESIAYSEDDFVTHNNNSYMCTVSHNSTADNEPDPEFDEAPGGSYWILVSKAPTEEAQSLASQLGEGLYDWVTDIENWGLGDYVGALALGGGLIWAGSQLNDMFEYDGVGDGQADSVYNGDATYSGAFTEPTLVATLQKICDYAGVTSYDTSLIDPSTTVNFTVGQITSARTLLDLLSKVYGFSMTDSGGTLKFVPIDANTTPIDLTEEVDLGFVPDGRQSGAPYFGKRIQGSDLPRSVELTYFSEANAHNEFVQTVPPDGFDYNGVYNNTYSDGTDVKITVPFTLDDAEAYTIAERIFINSHLERTTYTFDVGLKHIYLEPGDFVDVDTIGVLRIVRVDEKSENIFTITCTDAGPDRNTLQESGNANAATPPTYTDVTPYVGYSAGLIVELPPLDASDVEPRLTLYPHGYGVAGWTGCTIYSSIDGVNYTPFTSSTVSSNWGRVATPIPSVTDTQVWDETTTITVEMKVGQLSSKTDLEVLNGENWALVGEEIIGFRNATLQSGTTYQLSGLLRGRRGTDALVDSHVANEGFIMLDGAGVEFPYSLDQSATTFYFKFVTIGSDITKATAYTGQPSGKSRRPWAPANLTATYEPLDWVISWTARNHFNGEMTDSGTVTKPLNFGGFVIQILNPANDAIMRTITQQQSTFTYTDLQQIQDFGIEQTQIKVTVTQIDLDTGPGYTTIGTFGS